MDIANLTAGIIETMGGAIEFSEYALAQVLLPEKYKERFQNRTELLLAFDYEVAEENPNSDFVTFGSEVLETLLDIALKEPMSDVRYAIVDRVEVVNPEKRIQLFLDGRFDINVLSQRPVMAIWAVFVFRAHFTSSESFEEERHIWVNMLNNTIDTTLADHSLFFERTLNNFYPYTEICTFYNAYSTAKAHMDAIAETIAGASIPAQQIEQETQRLTSYYEDLIKENDRRLLRKGTTPEHMDDIAKKSAAFQLERERQIAEIKDNLIPKASTHLAHGITVHIPVIELICTVADRQGKEERTFYYECLTKSIF